jgi:hypothetical protein
MAGAHDELGLAVLDGEQVQMAVVFDAGVVEVGEIAPVVDDALGIRVRKAHSCERRELKGRLAVRRLAQADTHTIHPTDAPNCISGLI